MTYLFGLNINKHCYRTSNVWQLLVGDATAMQVRALNFTWLPLPTHYLLQKKYNEELGL